MGRPHDPGPILFDLAVEVIGCLNRSGSCYALCGGLAVASHGFSRATRDIDILIEEADIAKADSLLAQAHWFVAAQPIAFPDGMTLHRRCKVVGREMIVLDLLVQPPGSDWLSDRILQDIFGAAGYLVSRRALTEMKRLAGRPQDLTDLERLREGEGA